MFNFSRKFTSLAAVTLSAALLAGTWGCFKDNGPCPAASITVSPNPSTVVVGTTRQFTAVARDIRGNALTAPTTWAVVAGGGSINASGLFTAGSVVGTYANTVQATNTGLVGTATVNVVASGGTLATITVTPNPASMAVNATQTFVAVGRDASNNVVPITPVWAVVAGGGTINSSSGQFTAGTTTGTFSNTVRATSGSISGLATVVVTAGGGGGNAVLGSAATFAVLAGATVSNTGATTTITGDIGLSPGSSITGIPAGQPVGGAIHISDAPAVNAQSNLTTAYNDLAGRACGTNMTSLDLGGRTLPAGVYCFNSTAGLTGALVLDGGGNPNAVFVFQVASALTTASNSAVTLIGGANANNVYWQVSSSATIGTGSTFKGNIVALQSITLGTGASLSGRALARNGSVTMSSNAVSLP